MSEARKHDAIQGDIVHEYDGIEEADNQLPRWWLITFFGTVVFALLYWSYYETWQVAPGPRGEYQAEVAARASEGGEVTDEALVAMASDSSAVANGQTVFQSNCVACHGDRGQGNIGPNLTDNAWIHGGSPTQIYATVRDGVAARGMPTWGPILGNASMGEVIAYVLSIRDTNVEGPRGPEGDPYVPGGATPAPAPAGDAPTAPAGDAPPADAPAADAPAAPAADAPAADAPVAPAGDAPAAPAGDAPAPTGDAPAAPAPATP
jgi:cytochrome c oxidase cbb3-type subunit 3